MIEYRDKAYVFFETKYADGELPHGQRLALERLVRDVGKSGKKAIAVVVRHHVRDTNESVPVADCEVTELFFSGENEWRAPKTPTTAFRLFETFIRYAETRTPF
jgi:hypothetical protein